MIQTRYGSEIKPLKHTGGGWFKVRRIEDKSIHFWHMRDFIWDMKGGEILVGMIKRSELPDLFRQSPPQKVWS